MIMFFVISPPYYPSTNVLKWNSLSLSWQPGGGWRNPTDAEMEGIDDALALYVRLGFVELHALLLWCFISVGALCGGSALLLSHCFLPGHFGLVHCYQHHHIRPPPSGTVR